MNHFVATNITDKNGFLNEEESHHACRVLRLEQGDLISVTKGDGKVYQAKISIANKKKLGFCITQLLRIEKQSPLHLAVAPTKSNDRFEFFLEKATEFGVHSITPIICQNSERKIYKEERGKKIILSAVKQSKKGFIPTLNPAIVYTKFLNSINAKQSGIAHLEENKKLSINTINFAEPFCFLIGPEGDFSPEEIDLAKSAGIKAYTLGNEVLRTETAAISIACLAAFKNV